MKIISSREEDTGEAEHVDVLHNMLDLLQEAMHILPADELLSKQKLMQHLGIAIIDIVIGHRAAEDHIKQLNHMLQSQEILIVRNANITEKLKGALGALAENPMIHGIAFNDAVESLKREGDGVILNDSILFDSDQLNNALATAIEAYNVQLIRETLK